MPLACIDHTMFNRVTVTNIITRLYLFTLSFARAAESVVIQHRLSVRLSGDPSGQHHSRETTNTEAGALTSAKTAPLVPL